MDDGKVDALDEMDMAASNLDAMSIDLHGRAGRYGKDLRVARESVAELIRLAANAERIIRNCVNADQLPEGYMHHADGLRDALARVRSS